MERGRLHYNNIFVIFIIMPTAEEARENRARRRVILDNQRLIRRIAIAREADERRNSEEAMNRAELPRMKDGIARRL